MDNNGDGIIEDDNMELLVSQFDRIAADKGYTLEQGGEGGDDDNNKLTEEMKEFARQSMALQRSKSKYIQGQTNLLLQNIQMGFKPWEIETDEIETTTTPHDDHDNVNINEDSSITNASCFLDRSLYVQHLDSTKILKTWGIMYCGGSIIIEKQLRTISKEYNLGGIHIESFGW